MDTNRKPPHSPRGMYKMVWKNIWKSLKLDRSWLLKSESRNGWRKVFAAEQAGASWGQWRQEVAQVLIDLLVYYCFLSVGFCCCFCCLFVCLLYFLLDFSPDFCEFAVERDKPKYTWQHCDFLIQNRWMNCRKLPKEKQRPPKRRSDGKQHLVL